jgi:hypothetical protein
VGLSKDITMVESEWNKDPYRKELVFLSSYKKGECIKKIVLIL